VLRDNEVLVAYHDATIKNWNLRTGEIIGAPLRCNEPVAALDASADNSLVVTTGGDEVFLWRMPSKDKPMARFSLGVPVRCAAISGDGMLIAAAGERGQIALWRDGQEVLRPQSPSKLDASCLAFSADHKLLAAGFPNGEIEVWGTKDGRSLNFQSGLAQQINTLVFSPDSRFLLSGGRDKSARLWSLALKKQFGPPAGHSAAIRLATFSADGSAFATFGADHTTRVWKTPSEGGTSLETNEHEWVRAIAFSPDSKLVLTAGGIYGKRGFGRLYDVESGRTLTTSFALNDLARIAAFSPDGQTVLLAGDGVVQLADVATGNQGPIIKCSKVRAAIYNPRGDHILTTSEDGTAQLWDARTGTSLGVSIEHGALIVVAGFSADGEEIYTTDQNGN
ncbi:MAG: WD40 repeat domain-containing protein, partial [Candidatus Acidiferrum sp.]